QRLYIFQSPMAALTHPTAAGTRSVVMLRKVASAVILAPLAVLIVLFAVANREPIIISFDPFNPVAPAFTMQVPLFIFVLVLVLIGVVVGGVAAWLRQNRARRTARRL